jgi:hypothetical protein
MPYSERIRSTRRNAMEREKKKKEREEEGIFCLIAYYRFVN